MGDGGLIGIVGGVGPYAGLDLARKICDETIATTDQEHLRVALLSVPGVIPDRTAYLLGAERINPALGILEMVARLEELGCRVIGVPCNTAHAPAIWDVIVHGLRERGSSARVLHMVEETSAAITAGFPAARRVGVLSTLGTQRSGVYPAVLGRHGLEVITLPEPELTELVHTSIYDPGFGIKAHASPVSGRARRNVAAAAERLRVAGAQLLVLGCTELPLALPETEIGGMPVVDSTRVLARALIRAVAPDKLRA